MLFNSLHFLLFFLVVVAVYFALPHRYRWMFLLAASCYFYMCWKAEYILLLLTSIAIDYYAGIQMEKVKDKPKRKKFLILSLCTNLTFLFCFKYFNFFNDSFAALFRRLNILYDFPAFHVLLPLGISFYTFQAMSYAIDVYRGHLKAERNFARYALYVTFFPHLVAGPIVRATNLLPQFRRKIDFEPQRVSDGLKLMLWGFFKKVVIADRLAIYVNQVYNNPSDYRGGLLLLATYFFAFQVFCDFSGYTDIAIGSAQVMGFRLPDNFNRPFFSKSISEFWKRWHISLSSWFKDYLYVPLGGSRVAKWRWYFNLSFVFLVSGFWHGANWTFVIWGALHGFYMLFSIWTGKLRERLTDLIRLNQFPVIQKYLKIFTTFHLVVFSLIFFRANSVSDAFLIIRRMLQFSPSQISISSQLGLNVIFGRFQLMIALLSILFMELVHMIQGQRDIRQLLSQKPLWIRWGVYYAVIFVMIFFGVLEANRFIYFQF